MYVNKDFLPWLLVAWWFAARQCEIMFGNACQLAWILALKFLSKPGSWFAYFHYGDVIMGAMASQITSLTIIYSTVYSRADQRKHQSSASLAFVRGIYQWPVNSPHKWPVTRKMFPFDDVIMVFVLSLKNRQYIICDMHQVLFCHFITSTVFLQYWPFSPGLFNHTRTSYDSHDYPR